jgi:cytidylate kinase
MDRSPRTVNAIVDEQIQRWQAAQARARAVPPPPRPLITISRQYGARGAALAHLLAERLGLDYWGRQILDEMARRAQTSPEAYAPLDEHHRSPLAATIGEMMYSTVTPGEYERELAHVVHDLDAKGGAVIVGHGAQYLLPIHRALRVRVVCQVEQRIASVVERSGITAAEARAEIAAVDRDRRAFIRDHFRRDVDDPADYDLWVNSGTLGLSASADIVIAAYHIRFPTPVRI